MKNTFLNGFKMTSADSNLTWKRLKTIQIDSADHLKTFIPYEHFSIGAIFGPKTTCEVEWFSQMMKKREIGIKSHVFDGKIVSDRLCQFGHT